MGMRAAVLGIALALGVAGNAAAQGPETGEEDREPETADREPETADREPETADREPETADREPETADREPETADPGPEPDAGQGPDAAHGDVLDAARSPDAVTESEPVSDAVTESEPVSHAVSEPAPAPSSQAARDAVRAVATHVRSAEYRDDPPPRPLTSEVWFWAAIVAATVGVFLTVLVDITTDDPSPGSVRSGLTLSWP